MWRECGREEVPTWQGAAQDSGYLSQGPGRVTNISGWSQNLQLQLRSVFLGPAELRDAFFLWG